ncbi:MAG TPA: LysM peptidoglycan-binding domain-containing protein, partial [Planctomycetaceae bacterium]|nr:LysM peptidoglycan-binding domain-containing protein [Planctomycetaceae bacterium]
PVTEKKPEPKGSEQFEPADPFGPASTANEVVEQSKPSEAGDPFGDVWAESPKAEQQPDHKPEQKSDDPPVLEFGDVVTDKDKPSPVMKEDPFGESGEPATELRTEPTEGDPFATSTPKLTVKPKIEEESPSETLEFPDGPTLIAQPTNSPAASEEKFSEPLPVLERVPERPEPTSKNPFGEFEVVPAGSSRASSTTHVAAREFPERKDPFETPTEQPRTLAQDLPRVASGDGTVRTYRIQENDTYWKISQAAYQTSQYYQALARYNRSRISDPTKMPLGQEILLPPERELEAKYPDLFPGAQAADRTIVQTAGDGAGFLTDKLGTPQYRVGENDTLSAIAQRHLGRASRWIQIYELNRKQIPDPNRLKIGTVLTLPSDASNVRVIGERSDSTFR